MRLVTSNNENKTFSQLKFKSTDTTNLKELNFFLSILFYLRVEKEPYGDPISDLSSNENHAEVPQTVWGSFVLKLGNSLIRTHCEFDPILFKNYSEFAKSSSKFFS